MFPLCFQAVYWPLGIVFTYKFPEEICFPLTCFPGISYTFLLMSILSVWSTHREKLKWCFLWVLWARSALIGSRDHFRLEKHCFCRYSYTSFLPTLVWSREQLCLQCWGWRGLCAGYSGRVLLKESPLLQTISVSTPSKKQRTIPLFSCLCSIKEATDKEEDVWKL